MSSNNGKKMTNRDWSREAALRSYDSVMFGLRSIIQGLHPHQTQLVQKMGQQGPTVVSPEVFLSNLAQVALRNIQQGLAKNGFMGNPAPPPKQEEAKPEEKAEKGEEDKGEEPPKPRLLGVDDD